MSARQILHALGLRDRKSFRERYLLPALEHALVEMTHPESPRARNQKYRLTAGGRRRCDDSDGENATLLALSAAGLRSSAGWKPAQKAPDSGKLRGWLTMVRGLELRCGAICEARRLLEEARASAVEAPHFKGLVPLN